MEKYCPTIMLSALLCAALVLSKENKIRRCPGPTSLKPAICPEGKAKHSVDNSQFNLAPDEYRKSTKNTRFKNPASYIEICSREDPHLEDCIMNSIEHLRPQLKSGIPELDVPAMEPLLLNEVVVSRGSDAARFRAVGHNVKVYGVSNFDISNLKIDIENLNFYIGVKIPELYFNGEYDVNARILVVPLTGKGPIRANATDCEGNVVLHGERYQKNGEAYLRFKAIDVDLRIGNYHVQLENLFGGDNLLGEATNAALNENKAEIMKTLRPIAERTVGEVVLEIANKITRNFAISELFQ